jgi:hypothetical protein
MNGQEFVSSTKQDILQRPSSLCLTQRLGEGAVGDGWRGTFSFPSEPSSVLDIVAKVGWRDDARNSLVRETCIYHTLKKHNVNGVPGFIGLFDDTDDQVPILVTTYAGEEIRVVDDSLKYVTIPPFVVSTQLKLLPFQSTISPDPSAYTQRRYLSRGLEEAEYVFLGRARQFY